LHQSNQITNPDSSIFNGKLKIGNFLLFCYLPCMSRAPSFCAVVLAAGESTRMGTDKALLPWPPPATGPAEIGLTAASRQTFLSAAIAAFSPFADMVIVVAGGNESVLAPVVYANGAELVQNPEPARGQFSSLQVGLHEVLNRGRDAAMITLVDRPPVSAATLKTLLAAFQTAVGNEKWAVVPEYQGKHGHPILAGREMIEAFLRAPATATAREIQQQNQDHIEYVAVDDPSITINVNTPEDYAALGVPR
jgi:molybdenum cofactor cytidylyltransferase